MPSRHAPDKTAKVATQAETSHAAKEYNATEALFPRSDASGL